MVSKKRRRNPWFLISIVIATVVLIGGLTWLFNINNPGDQPAPTPSPTATKTDAQNIVENTSYLYMSAIVENISAQTSVDDSSKVRVDTETSNQAADGSPAALATINLSDLPKGVDVQKNIQFLKDFLATQNTETKSSLTMLEAADEFKNQPEIVGAVKIYDTADNPVNPAIVDVLYFEKDDELTVTVTATVYLSVADNDE